MLCRGNSVRVGVIRWGGHQDRAWRVLEHLERHAAEQPGRKLAAASYAAEAAVFELRMAGMTASGEVRHAMIGKAAEAITAAATAWGADLIILGPAHRGEFATRLRGSVTLQVLQHASCPVLVAAPAGKADTHSVAAEASAATAR